MTKQEFLNFKEISSTIPFEDVLNWLNVPYHKKNEELHGENFIVSTKKNLFFSKKDSSQKGSIINFVSIYNEIDLREAALLLKHQFLTNKEVKPKRDMPELELEWDVYLESRGISPEIANTFETGYVKQRSILSGRIAFKMYDYLGNHIGYIGYKVQDGSWFFPKGFKRPLFNSQRLKSLNSIIVTTDPFETLRINSMGYSEVVSLLANSMTDEQFELLKKFNKILLLHQQPENIIQRLYPFSFIKAPILHKPLKELNKEDLSSILKPLI